MTGMLDRRLGLGASVAVGMSAMIGAGLFVVFPPAVEAAGDGLVPALVLAACVAACNAISSARLARAHPVAGGTYVYGREQLGPFWGHLAGWSFVAGKIASCAAMALAVGAYVWPEHARIVALLTVAALTALNLAGVEKSAAVSMAVVTLVVTAVACAIVAMIAAPGAGAEAGVTSTPGGVLEASALLFFAFAGYARLATLGEEVRNPHRTIPVAIGVSFVAVLTLYITAALALRHVLGAEALSGSDRPWVSGAESAGADGLVPVLAAAAALAAGGALLSLLLGVSRTTLAMARDGHLPRPLAAVSPRTRVPAAAEVAVALVVGGLVVLGDLTTAVAFSSFCVLVYYAVANLSAWTLGPTVVGRLVAALGLVGCGVLASSLPPETIGAGAAVVLLGVMARPAGRRLVRPRSRPERRRPR